MLTVRSTVGATMASMTASLEPGSVQPSNEAVATASSELIELVVSHLPQRFYAGEHPWRMFGAAVIVRMTDTVESLMALMATGLPIDGLILLRALYEQVIRYLWISIDPDNHIEAWGSNARWQMRKLHNDALKFGQTVMDDSELAAAEGSKELPGLADLALAVDTHWGGKMIGFRSPATGQQGILTMRGLYTMVYRTGSRAAHVQPDSLEPYGELHVSPRVIRRPGKDDPSIWWPLALALYSHALIVCNDQLNWPDPDRVRAINNGMYAPA
jgi:hypothetical protein